MALNEIVFIKGLKINMVFLNQLILNDFSISNCRTLKSLIR